MRFRYFDSEGTEVGLSSVDALRFRIETGVVTPETLLYDAAAGQWAPARQNPLFRFLVEEDEDLLPEEHRPLMEGTGTSARAAPEPGIPAEGDALDLSSMDPAAADSDALDDDGFPAIELSLPDTLAGSDNGPEADEMSEPDAEAAAAGAESDSVTGSVPQRDVDVDPEPDIQLGSDWPGAAEPGSSTPSEPTTSDSGSATSGSAPGSPERAAVKERRRGATPSAAAPPRWSPPKSKMEFQRSEPRSRRRRPPSLAGVVVLSILMVFLVGIPILLLGGSGEGEEGSAYARVGDLAGDLISGGGSGAAEEEGGETPAGESDAEAGETLAARPDRLTSGEIDALAADVEAAAAGDLAEALADLRGALDLPDGPPVEWLEDRYLAAADSFPRVERYWMGFSSLVKSMQELEAELYRGFVQNRVLRMRLDTADAARLSARALARWEASTGDRESTYRNLELLAANALALHDTLEARSELIAFRPFEGAELSRYPVMAAVPDDPVLAEHIWSRMSRTLDLLQSLDGSRPESVAEIQEAVRRTTLLATVGGAAPRTVSASAGPTTSDFASGGEEIPTAADLPVPTQDLPDLD